MICFMTRPGDVLSLSTDASSGRPCLRSKPSSIDLTSDDERTSRYSSSWSLVGRMKTVYSTAEGRALGRQPGGAEEEGTPRGDARFGGKCFWMTSLVRRSTQLLWIAVSEFDASLPASLALSDALGWRAARMGVSKSAGAWE